MEVIPGRSVGTKSEDYVETEQEESQQKPKKAELISKISQNKENTATNTYDGKENNKYKVSK